MRVLILPRLFRMIAATAFLALFSPLLLCARATELEANTNAPEVEITVQAYEFEDDAFSRFQLDRLEKLTANKGEFLGWVSGILTEPDFKAVSKSIEAKRLGDVLSEEKVTTLSGRQVHVEVVDVLPLNDGYGSQAHWATNNLVELDVVPNVDTNGYTIQLTLIPTKTETFGDGLPSDSNGTNGGAATTGQLPPPHSRVRQLVTNCTMGDGQTAVFVLNPPFAQKKKKLVVFVTPVILDSSGNPKNSAANLPFVQKSVPPQTAH